jgi:hypothetical protein
VFRRQQLKQEWRNNMAVVRISAEPPYQAIPKVYDYDGNNNVIYEGWAAHPGALTTDAVWAIKKNVFVGTNLVQELWAGGNTNYDKVWANRASLIYA